MAGKIQLSVHINLSFSQKGPYSRTIQESEFDGHGQPKYP